MFHYIAETGGFRGGCTWRVPSLIFAEIERLTVWMPPGKRMHQIMPTDFENYTLSPLLREHIDTPCPQRVLKFCQSLNWAPPLSKNPGSAPEKYTEI